MPLRDYEQFIPYIDQIKKGTQNVLWKGRPIYFAKTSGTTSGVKYIPITKESISNHINGARNALLAYMSVTGNTQFAGKKMIFLSGSPALERVGGIPTGRLSGIVNHHIPQYLTSNQLPSYATNCIEAWEQKLDKIVEETIDRDLSLIGAYLLGCKCILTDWLKRQENQSLTFFPTYKFWYKGVSILNPIKENCLIPLEKR